MKILLVGAGGYALEHIKAIQKLSTTDIKLEGIVDPFVNKTNSLNTTIYDTMEEFYTHHTADLAIICTPTFLHKEHSLCALAHGSYVLCEKPVASTVADAIEMIEAEKKHGKWIAIGYQWSFADAILKLKEDVLSGIFGKPISFKTAVSWPRNIDYYNRGSKWAGRISMNGITILDSIASNACAHYAHNMIFLLGNKMNTSTEISEVKGQCFRANDIENFDTCFLKLKTNENVPLYFAASHATEKVKDPEFVYTFEKAKIVYSKEENPVIKAVFNDGREITYGDPFENNFKKITDCLDAIKNGTTPVCTVETAIPHTRLIDKIYKEIPITAFEKEQISYKESENRLFVPGLFEKMYEAYENENLLI